MPDAPDPELAVFSAARRLPPDQRAAYLDQACRGDVVLRQRIEGLLQAGEEAGPFLEKPAPGVEPPPPAASPLGPGGTIRVTVFPAEKLGDRVGRYKILQQIGEGGCGVVYMAEQEEPVKRRVALKVIKLGMDTKQVIARFEAERQALALMDHPNIAKVLDAGATETGRPYFVMELVRGIKITDYCDQNNLSTQARLDLFMQVCRAVQHAHQKGIIHRDIKPSNILVTMNDGVPVPKVIDFGIAKATQGKLTDHTVFTAFEQFIGTPAYMSPEQAEMSGLDIDTRSDLYSLGVLLYELLTGKTPFDARELLEAGIEGMRRHIREKEPARPSTRLSTMMAADLTSVARHRQSAAPKLIHMVRGDLDWIVMKCLEKDRTRRYETANGLAADIQRHLNNEPVVASPPGKWYRFQKMARRNKIFFTAVACVALSLLAGLCIALYLYARERQAERTARTEAANSQQVARFLQEMIAGAGPDSAKGKDTALMREILEKTEQRVGLELTNQPAVAAQLLMTIAEVYAQFSDFTNSENLTRRAISLKQSVDGKDDALAAQWLDNLGYQQVQHGDRAAAEISFSNALDIEKRVLGKDNPRVSHTLVNMAQILHQSGNIAGAEAALREVIDRVQKAPGPEQPDEADLRNNLGLLLWSEGELPEAEASTRAALSGWQKKYGAAHPQIAITLLNLGRVLHDRGDIAEAETTIRQALDMEKKLFGTNEIELEATVLDEYSRILRDQGNLALAETNSRRALAVATKVLSPAHPSVGNVGKGLAATLRRRGALETNASALRESLRLDPTDPMTADALTYLLAVPSLNEIGPASTQNPWRYTLTRPASNWATADDFDASWRRGEPVGFTHYMPRSKQASTSHTNIWLRRTFDLRSVPGENIEFRVSCDHDAQVFVNGVLAATADWTDAAVLTPCSQAGRAAFKQGANVLAVYCQDADGGAPIAVDIFSSKEPAPGRKELLEEFNQRIAAEPRRAALYFARAGLHARQSHWQEAAEDLSKASELSPSDPVTLRALGLVLLETGEVARYEHLRTDALPRLAKGVAPSPSQVLFLLASPASGNELETAATVADLLAGTHPEATLGWRQFAKGLAEFRLGHWSKSIDWTGQARSSAARESLPLWNHERESTLTAASWAVEAMAKWRSGQPIPARVALDKAAQIVEQQLPAPDYGDLGRDWPAWLTARLFLKEAQTMISERH